MNSYACRHITDYKYKEGLVSYEILHAFYVACLAKDSRRRKAKDCVCMVVSCPTRYQRVHACLLCPYFGCYNGKHIHKHSREKNHLLAVDINFGYVYCFKCGDYQYDADFDRIAQKQKQTAARKRGEVVSQDYKWEPGVKEMEFLMHHIVINADHIKGMRGILNMGNTCYLSVIILALVHAPAFRDYLLSLRHKCRIQNAPATPKGHVKNQKLRPVCFVCEMSKIVQEFFCGKSEPFFPHRLLYLVWMHFEKFRSVEQQDAHEFLLKLLDFLHLHQVQSEGVSTVSQSCNCIIDTIFTCTFREESTCQDCKFTLRNFIQERGIFLQQSINIDKKAKKAKNGSASTIHWTLDSFIERTQFDIEQKTCNRCKKIKAHHKRFTLNKLPIVLTFYLPQNASLYGQLFVSFPEFLDMTPFISSSSKENCKPVNGACHVSDKYLFYLFAVVVYRSSSKVRNGGHYVAYVRRHKNDWFHMDDKDVVEVTLEDVLQTKACVLFYHKEVLEYEKK